MRLSSASIPTRLTGDTEIPFSQPERIRVEVNRLDGLLAVERGTRFVMRKPQQVVGFGVVLG